MLRRRWACSSACRPAVDGCQSVELDLAKLARLDGTGAVLLARLLDRLEAMGHPTQVVAVGSRRAASS